MSAIDQQRAEISDALARGCEHADAVIRCDDGEPLSILGICSVTFGGKDREPHAIDVVLGGSFPPRRASIWLWGMTVSIYDPRRSDDIGSGRGLRHLSPEESEAWRQLAVRWLNGAQS